LFHIFLLCRFPKLPKTKVKTDWDQIFFELLERFRGCLHESDRQVFIFKNA